MGNNTDGPEAVPGGPTGSGPQQPKTPKSPPYPFPPTCSTSGSSDSPGWSSWGRFLGRPILPRAGADAASNQWGTTAMVPQQHPARAPPRRGCSPTARPCTAPTCSLRLWAWRRPPEPCGSRAWCGCADLATAWAPRWLQWPPAPPGSQTVAGTASGGGGREKTMRLRRAAKPVIEVRDIPAEERRRTSRAGQASPIRRWSGCPTKPQTAG